MAQAIMRLSIEKTRRGASLHQERLSSHRTFQIKRNGETGIHEVRPTLWSVPLAVPPHIVEIVEMVCCSRLHSLSRFLDRMQVALQDSRTHPRDAG
jgi:hypothetical protein